MAYTKVGWVNGSTPANQANLDHMDQGIKDAHDQLAAFSTIEYENAWSAGVAYQPGDVVIHQGVEYIAVNPSTGSAPPTAAPPGGAGMQATIFDAKGDLLGASAADTPVRVPVGADGFVLAADAASAAGVKWVARLGATPATAPSNDLNLIAESGWYYYTSGTLGVPPGSTYGYVQAYAWPGVFTVRQIAYEHGTTKIWQRSNTGATWEQMSPSFVQLTAAQYAALGAGVNANTLYVIVG